MLLVPSIGWKPGSGIVLEYLRRNTSTSSTVAWPAVAAGDLAIMVDFAQNVSGAPSAVTPTAFTNMVNVSGGSIPGGRFMASRKICTGSESGNLTGMNGDNLNQKALLIFGAGFASASHSTWNSQYTTGNPSSQNVAASGAGVPVLVIGGAATNNTTPAFSTASPAFDEQFTVGLMRVGYKVYNASQADHSIDMGDIGSVYNFLVSGYVEVG